MEIRENERRLADWAAETPASIAARLEGAKAAQTQARSTLGLMALISMMMLIATYNAYLSYDSTWVLNASQRQLTGEDSAAKVLTNQALRDWAASRIVTVALLGIRVSVDDAPVLGTAALLVLSLWLLLLARRENHTIGFLLRDTDSRIVDEGRERTAPQRFSGQLDVPYSSGQRWLIFHTVIANSLFLTCDRSLSRVQSLDGPNPLTIASTGFRGSLQRAMFELVRGFFFYFPAAACVIMFIFDRLSYSQPDPFALGSAVPGVAGAFYWESMTIFLCCWIPLMICCRRSSQYSSATENILRQYGNKLGRDLMRDERLFRPRSLM